MANAIQLKQNPNGFRWGPLAGFLLVLASGLLGSCGGTEDEEDVEDEIIDQLTTFLLTINITGDGEGGVISTPSGINCSEIDTVCSARFDSGSRVTLNVYPSPDNAVEEWSGGGCSGAGTSCVVTMNADTEIFLTLTQGDPLYDQQWHIKNTGQSGATAGEDINAEPVWDVDGIKGRGIRIVVVDDGVEIGHEDLAANVAVDQSWDYQNSDTDPSPPQPSASDPFAHGTAVAGLIAARDLNGVGVRGVAPRASLIGYNAILTNTDADKADAMSRDAVDNAVSSNSWGSFDSTGMLESPPSLWESAIQTGLASGRFGRGIVYVFAGGNGAERGDNSNHDGYVNNRGIIAVGAVGNDGRQADFSESGANLWVSAPGSDCVLSTDRTGELPYNDSSDGTSDVSNRSYTCFSGTSAAAPVVSGVVGLILEANPNLGWRDVRLILARTARKNHASDSGWLTTGTNPRYNFNHKYGFGVPDAQAAVALARSWTNLGQERTHTTDLESPNEPIADMGTTTSTITVSNSGIDHIEYVEITFSASHTEPGDLEILLTGPDGSQSLLSEPRGCSSGFPLFTRVTCSSFNGWVFGSARHLGAAANGDWTLTVRDRVTGDSGTLQSWRLKFYGTGEPEACSSTQNAGGDTPDTRQIELGQNSGSFDFYYETYNIRDRLRLHYEGELLFDSGCVGEDRTVPINYSGNSSVIAVEVIPNCEGTSGTAWEYTVNCPQ
ncbi:MAG: S8 family serine peptidase [Candidatus Thiodiazotropha taylori]|nr:S8 family serine peptidase [Candidatus Thiodiazotropha taylori]